MQFLVAFTNGRMTNHHDQQLNRVSLAPR